MIPGPGELKLTIIQKDLQVSVTVLVLQDLLANLYSYFRTGHTNFKNERLPFTFDTIHSKG
jgi:hypothetical protein